ncbi:MAG TPA: hypothetical protein VGI75_12595 [Pirellulales bacterium]
MRAATMLAAVVSLPIQISFAASSRTANFVVEAPTTELADKIGKAAEQYRHDLAISWTGQTMPNWSRPCPISAEVAPQLGAGGQTSFVFDRGEVFGWEMHIQGSEERVLDSVLPHEVTHTIFASYFRQPLPRWADEGACTTVEHISERSKQQVMLINFLRTDHGIAFDKLFAMKEYPHDVLPLYSEGYSLARFLIDQWGRPEFMAFVAEGMKSENWTVTVKKHYGFDNLQVLQDNWLDWVKQGSPALQSRGGEMLASNQRNGRSDANPVFRAQSDDRDTPNNGGRVMLASTRAVSPASTSQDAPPAGGDRGWTSPASASRGLTASASNDSASGNNSSSVYDRRAATTNLPPVADTLDPATRQPEYLASRSDATAPPREHQVLMDWTRRE